jgi:hypothetical protein
LRFFNLTWIPHLVPWIWPVSNVFRSSSDVLEVAQSVFWGARFITADVCGGVELLYLATHFAFLHSDARAPSTVSKHPLLWQRFTAYIAAHVPLVYPLNALGALVAMYMPSLCFHSVGVHGVVNRPILGAQSKSAIACHHALGDCVSTSQYFPL